MNELYQEYINITDEGLNGDKIFPASSIGLNKILIRLAEDSIKPNPMVFRIYLINIMTCLRNNIQNDNPIQACDTDMQTLLLYLTKYSNIVTTLPTTIIFYLPKYVIPEDCARPTNKAMETLLTSLKKIDQTIPKNITQINTGNVSSYIVKLKAAISPIHQMISYMRQLSNTRIERVGLLTHVPLDMHLLNHVDMSYVIESYSARYIPRNELGMKVFKSTYIPFNTYTHIVFGDKFHIKPILQRNKRKQAYTLAEDHKWHLKTKQEILNELINCGVDKSYLTKFKL